MNPLLQTHIYSYHLITRFLLYTLLFLYFTLVFIIFTCSLTKLLGTRLLPFFFSNSLINICYRTLLRTFLLNIPILLFLQNFIFLFLKLYTLLLLQLVRFMTLFVLFIRMLEMGLATLSRLHGNFENWFVSSEKTPITIPISIKV